MNKSNQPKAHNVTSHGAFETEETLKSNYRRNYLADNIKRLRLQNSQLIPKINQSEQLLIVPEYVNRFGFDLRNGELSEKKYVVLKNKPSKMKIKDLLKTDTVKPVCKNDIVKLTTDKVVNKSIPRKISKSSEAATLRKRSFIEKQKNANNRWSSKSKELDAGAIKQKHTNPEQQQQQQEQRQRQRQLLLTSQIPKGPYVAKLTEKVAAVEPKTRSGTTVHVHHKQRNLGSLSEQHDRVMPMSHYGDIDNPPERGELESFDFRKLVPHSDFIQESTPEILHTKRQFSLLKKWQNWRAGFGPAIDFTCNNCSSTMQLEPFGRHTSTCCDFFKDRRMIFICVVVLVVAFVMTYHINSKPPPKPLWNQLLHRLPIYY